MNTAQQNSIFPYDQDHDEHLDILENDESETPNPTPPLFSSTTDALIEFNIKVMPAVD